MKLKSIQAAEAKLLLSTYERNPILFVDGQGMYLIDENGEWRLCRTDDDEIFEARNELVEDGGTMVRRVDIKVMIAPPRAGT